jgi:Tfp pilus assembly protein FimV
MNELRAGAQLALPAESDLGAVGPGEASAEVSRQYQAWAQGRGASTDAGQLRWFRHRTLLSQVQGRVVATPPCGSGQELQRQLAEAQRALEVRNAELATAG